MAGFGNLLKNRSFVSLTVAGAGSFAAPTASLVVLLYSISTAFTGAPHPVQQGALALAFLGLSSTVPTLVTAVFSGTIADRVDRVHLMRWANAAALLATGAVLALLYLRPGTPVDLFGRPEYYFPEWILLLYPLWAVQTTSVTLFRPAFNASLPILVDRASLGRANGLVYATALALSIGGSLLAGLLTDLYTPELALVVPIALFLLTQFFLLGITTALSPPPTSDRAPFLAEAREGYRFLWDRRPLLGLTFAALVINFFSAVAFVELGLYVVVWLAVHQAILVGAMMAGGSLGAAVGTLLINRFRFERQAGHFLVVLVVCQGVAVGVLGLVHTIWLALPDMFLFGLFPGMFTTVFLATIQATVPNKILGRVLAADEVGSFAMIPVGQYVGGSITAVAGIPAAYLIAGGGTVGVGAFMGLYGGIRQLGFQPNEDSPDASAGLTPSGVTTPDHGLAE
ncbi:MAG: MFS transporter [Thermoplasmata archaeon]|nr:MFS transporter [Thermoplasmata archaeon]